MDLELVIPAYNEEKNLRILIERTAKAAHKFGLTSDRFQLVVVNNGSQDNSSTLLKALANTDLGKWFRTLELQPNRGYGGGVLAGLELTQAPFVAVTHADLQCDPEDVFRAYQMLKGEVNTLIKGARTGRPLKDRIITKTFEGMSKLVVGMRSSEINAQPKLFHRSLLEKLKKCPTTIAFDTYLLYQAQKSNVRILELPVSFPERIHGQSHWTSSWTSRAKTIRSMLIDLIGLALREGRL